MEYQKTIFTQKQGSEILGVIWAVFVEPQHIYRNTEMRAETGSDPMSGHQINLVGDHCVPILCTNKHQGVPTDVFGWNSVAQRLAADQG